MRFRKGGKKGGDAFTHRRPSSPRNDFAVSTEAAMDDDTRSEIVAEYAQRIKAEHRRIMGEDKPIWDCHCSTSVLAALVIWLLIGLFVFVVVSREGFNGSYGVLMHKRVPPAGSGGTNGVRQPPRVDLAALPDGCKGAHCLKEGGSEAFGAILGAHNGVVGFSNCYAHTCISLLDHTIEVQLPANSALVDSPPPVVDGANGDVSSTTVKQRLTTGMKWQCVEYARRYWLLQGTPQPALFGSVEGAADIWDDLTHATLLDGSTTPLLKYGNGQPVGAGGSRPRVGDLIIYPRDTDEHGAPAHFPYGHVAVIVGVDEAAGLVYIAEQNWSSRPWPEPFHNYSRTLRMTVALADNGGTPPRKAYSIYDPFHSIQGWVRYGRYED